jgi:hypothetical protein
LEPVISSFVYGRVADVLSGDGTLTRAISLVVEDLVAYERKGAYPDLPVYPTKPFEHFREVLPGSYDCLLVSTVLHHEVELEELLASMMRVHARRWVAVENCISKSASVEFHEALDLFFNCILNQFDVDCPVNHRDAEGWLELLGKYGSARLVAQLDDVPGIPFPYEIFVVDMD